MTTHPVSPNTVLANALSHAEDALTPHILAAAPERIVFVVGTQINGAPHIGTSLVQSLTFTTAERVRRKFGVPVTVLFHALDNAPHTIVQDPVTGHRYQRAYAQALGEQVAAEQVLALYGPYFSALSERLHVPFRVETYSHQQATTRFRETWLRVLPRVSAARWWLAPSGGRPHLRTPCPHQGCGWAEKYAQRTRVERIDSERAKIHAVCLDHGEYVVDVTPTSGAYLDLATLYRNLVKELSLATTSGTLHVMVKGGDWVFGSYLVDGALQSIGLSLSQLPARLFCPQVVTDTGAKLSKSLIREGRAALPEGAEPWMLDTREWPGSPAEYVERLLALSELLLSDPRHFFRSYSAGELAHVMTTAPAPRSVSAP